MLFLGGREQNFGRLHTKAGLAKFAVIKNRFVRFNFTI
jgi:hypothetical protein